MNQPKKEASRIVVAQVVVILILGILGCWLMPVHWGLSLMIGGLIAWLPNFLLYRLLFKYFGAQYAQKFIKAFYFGQFIKFLLTLLGFVAVFVWTSWQPLPVFLGFMCVQSVFWFALLLTKKE